MDRSKLELVRSKLELELVRSKLELHRNRNLHGGACGKACATNHHGTWERTDRKHRKLVLARSTQELVHNKGRNQFRNHRTDRLVRWLRSTKERKRQSKLRK